METESQLSQEQVEALLRLQESHNVFLTGEAGAGKSFVIRHFRKNLCEKTFPTLASTGAAAVLVGGRTFHSFFGLGIMEGGKQATIARALRERRVVRRLKNIEGFIVDEISMISGETLEAAEAICRLARESSQPWGGVRVIVVGDFAQLPPVSPYGQRRRDWAFQSQVWEQSEFDCVYLRENHRTGDKDFLKVLNRLRVGDASEGVKEFLNMRSIEEPTLTSEGTRLFPRRLQTDRYNQNRLEELSGEIFVFENIYSGSLRVRDKLKGLAPVSDPLQLKLGAYVMIRMNDPKQRWVNGSTGFVKSLEDDFIVVELDNGRIAEVEKTTFSMLDAEGQVVAAVTNYPLSLAYAVTIHKAQGLSLDRLYADLGSLWEPGHAYVAVSRATSTEALHVLQWDSNSIRADADVVKFYSSLGQEDC